MQKVLFLNDWFYNEELIFDYFYYLSEKYSLCIEKSLRDCDVADFDIIVGWGSGCIDILKNMDSTDARKILISPYLDYNHFVYNSFYPEDNSSFKYMDMTGIAEMRYVDGQRDIKFYKDSVIYPEPGVWQKNVFVLFGDCDRLVPFKYYLYFSEMYNGCSFHLIENAGFAPFYGTAETNDKNEIQRQDIFRRIMEESVLS